MEIDEAASTLVQSRAQHVIPGYRIAHELGRGGMGVVYKATHLELQREVALKVVLPSRRVDPEFALRFLREARTVASLNHPHVVQAYDAGTAGGVLYLALELVDGEDVGTYLRRHERLAPREATQVVLDAARGLAHAHGSPAQVIHRDVKPGNLLRTTREDGSPLIKLTDFGLARSVRSGSNLTESGVIMGSPRYMSPEQALGKALDHRSDIYSLGATFYELLVGRPPLAGTHVEVLAQLVSKAAYPSPSERLGIPVSPQLERVLARMLEHDPDARYADYASLIADLEALLVAGAGAPAARPRRHRAHAALAGCAAALVGLVLACDAPDPTPTARDRAQQPAATAQQPAAPAQPTAPPRRFEALARRVSLRQLAAGNRELPAPPTVQAQRASVREYAARLLQRKPALPTPAPVERCSMRLVSGVEGAQAFVDGEPVALPGAITAERGAELELVVTAPGCLPLRRIVRADERTLQLDPHLRLASESPALAQGRLFPEPPRVVRKRELAPLLGGHVVAVASDEPRSRPARVGELVATGEGWARLPLWQAAQALADEQGKTAHGWAFDFGLETKAHATLKLATLSGEGRDLVLRVSGARLELGARSANGTTVLGVHDLLRAPGTLRLEWTGTHLRVSSRAADSLGAIYHPVFTHRLEWTPTDLGVRVRFVDLGDGAEAKLTWLDLAALGAPTDVEPRESTRSERLRLTSTVPGAHAFVGGAKLALPHELQVSRGEDVHCVVVAPGHSPLRRVLQARGQGEERLDPIPALDAWGTQDPTASLAVFPWLPAGREGVWHVVEQISAAGDHRVPNYAALKFDNPRGASMTAELDRQLAALGAKTEGASGWSLELGLEFDGAGTFECTPLRGAEGELSVRLSGSRLELLERPHDGQPRVVATHDLVTPPSTLRLEWNGTTARVSTRTVLDGGRLLPALVYAPRWSDLELGAARFSFADLEEFAILQCPRVTLLKP